MEDLGATLMAYWVLPGAIACAAWALVRSGGLMGTIANLVLGGVGGFIGSMAFVRLAPYVFGKPTNGSFAAALAASVIGGFILTWLMKRITNGRLGTI